MSGSLDKRNTRAAKTNNIYIYAKTSLKQKNILYHNHDENGVVYKYPRIQYKRINRKAAIVCVKEGVDAIHELFASGNFTYRIGEKDMEMRIESVNTYENDIDFCDTLQSYHLHNWLPLNSKNYNEYKGIERYADRIVFLEKKLKANFLAFFSSIKYHVEKQIILNIVNIKEPILISYKGVKLMAFDVDFNVNLSLPNAFDCTMLSGCSEFPNYHFFV